jgi:hypothetical protein
VIAFKQGKLRGASEARLTPSNAMGARIVSPEGDLGCWWASC